MPPNTIKAALQRGETVCAMWIGTGSPDLAEAAVHLGWRTIIIDNEHGVADLNQAVAIDRAIRSAGGEAILRIPTADPVYLKLALDRGIRSIMAPMINSRAEAEAFAAACRYPPRGTRGYAAPIVRGSSYGTTPLYVAERAHEDLLLIAQIEHTVAADAIADIAAVDGIDMLFIGPNDLAGSIDRLEKLESAELLALAEKVETDVLASGKYLGSIVRPGRSPRELHDLGCRLIAGPSDIGLFLEGARKSRPDYEF
ncbi:aldolase/citrate lyase family protein [Acuticoccus sp. M5D2P5]|uniref:HpcH/HpaI aldolase family protein n=1 Tax=Acuticoccus kalidii TaxID=2910977 RepID=UPI001F3DDA93|nr:aldolase/citrate lyase family protein [Acuticoccus kalidii]MCF3936082.1 aldolase/citrate lyase family protein [Acuticoccus kalidii]